MQEARDARGTRDDRKVRMPGSLVFVLVVAAGHAIGCVVGGWAVVAENRNKQDHGQDLIMSWGLAWFVALLCWGLAAMLIACAVLAHRRHTWVRVALIACLGLVTLSMVLAFFGSLAGGAPNLAAFLIAVVDGAALWTVSGVSGRSHFTARPAVTGAREVDAS